MKAEEIIEQLTKVKVEDLDEDALEFSNFVMKKLDYIDELEEEIEKKDKIIDEMAEQLVGLSIVDDVKDIIIFKNEEEVIKYFERKVENEN